MNVEEVPNVDQWFITRALQLTYYIRIYLVQAEYSWRLLLIYQMTLICEEMAEGVLPTTLTLGLKGSVVISSR